MPRDNKLVVASSWKLVGEFWEQLLKGMGFLFGVIKNVLKLIMVMVVQLCEYTKYHKPLNLCILKG
jgi:hypothetical protein